MPDQPADDAKRRPEAADPAAAKPADEAASMPAVPAAAKPADATAAKPAAQAAAAKPADETAATRAAPAAAEASKAGAPAAPVTAEEREALRRQWADEAREKTVSHDRKVRSFLLRLSLLNWGIAIVAWTISAALGITSPASIIVYSVLFVIGLVAAILAILTYLLEKFGHEPGPIGPISGGEGAGTAGEDGSAAEGDTTAPAAT